MSSICASSTRRQKCEDFPEPRTCGWCGQVTRAAPTRICAQRRVRLMIWVGGSILQTTMSRSSSLPKLTLVDMRSLWKNGIATSNKLLLPSLDRRCNRCCSSQSRSPAITNPASYNVARGVLVLQFELLFLRDPGPGEGDIVVGIPELVWVMVRD